MTALPYPPPYMPIGVLAAHLSVSPATIAIWTAEGILPAPIKPKGRGGMRLWSWKAVEAALAAGAPGVLQSADPFVAGVAREAARRERDG